MGSKAWLAGTVVAAVFAAATPSVSAQGKTAGPISVWNPIIAASVDRLSAESRSWRDALDAVAATGRRAIIVTPDMISGRGKSDGAYDFDSESLAGAQPIVDEQSRVDTVIVVVNLPLLQRLSGLPMASVALQEDLDRIIAHEVYGHAVPFLLAGSLSGKCADPERGQNATDACAIKRENTIREEAGLGRRLDYGRESLAITSRFRQ